MSTTEILVIEPNGDVEHFARSPHAPGGALTIWIRLAEKHLGWDPTEFGRRMRKGSGSDGFAPLWNLSRNSTLEWWERVCLIALTFDRPWVAMKNHQRLLEAIQCWLDEYGQGEGYASPNLPGTYQAIKNASIAANEGGKGYLGVCFHATSVSDDTWSMPVTVYDEEDDDSWEEESRSYNIFTDDEGHYELFESFPDLLQDEVPA